LHRLALRDYSTRKSAFDRMRTALEAEFVAIDDPTAAQCQTMWERHRDALPEWFEAARRVDSRGSLSPLAARYWSEQNRLDHMQ
jgi:hypothetical protein